jgi:hypothetical protein
MAASPLKAAITSEARMFPVEIRICDEEKLAETMESMRSWLDHQHYEPAGFRYRLGAKMVVFRVDFAVSAEAEAFAREFGGSIGAPQNG